MFKAKMSVPIFNFPTETNKKPLTTRNHLDTVYDLLMQPQVQPNYPLTC